MTHRPNGLNGWVSYRKITAVLIVVLVGIVGWTWNNKNEEWKKYGAAIAKLQTERAAHDSELKAIRSTLDRLVRQVDEIHTVLIRSGE